MHPCNYETETNRLLHVIIVSGIKSDKAWLRLPFGLKVAGDVFQERLDKVLGLLDGVNGIADDIVTHGTTENEHDGRVLALCETARMNNLSLNPKKMQFKLRDCKFFGHRITTNGIGVDSEKVEAITKMKAPEKLHGHGKLLKEVHSSIDRAVRTPQKTVQIRY